KTIGTRGRGMSDQPLADRIRTLDWAGITAALDSDGYAVTPALLDAAECRRLMALFEQDECFRNTVDMRQVRFGSGVYRYFDRPLPELVCTLRECFYPPLAELANELAERLRREERYPEELDAFLASCHDHG